jgi:hypothetical protein
LKELGAEIYLTEAGGAGGGSSELRGGLRPEISELLPKHNIDGAGVLDGSVEGFNNWAANPTGPLPEGFMFIAETPKIRAKQTFTESKTPTLWITNREGAKKYLFPNPAKFNQMTHIKDLADYDMGALKAAGKNTLKITKPIEMTAEGWIEFKGAMELQPQRAEDVENARMLFALDEDAMPTPEQIAKAKRQYAEVKARYKGTPQWMIEPNGKPTNLNETQWVQVRTPLFKEYFGDWET